MKNKKMKTIISKDEYKRRKRLRNNKSYNSEKAKEKYKDKLKESGKITKEEEISQRRIKIKDLLAKGLKQKDICLKLNISKDTYLRDRKYLKEQSLI